MAGKIFVNYRREDTRSDAARIRDRLVTAFGKPNVFMDVDNLLAGQRFDQELNKALNACDIFLAVIGSRWQQVIYDRAQAGGRDYVREEIAAALARGITVIPVLIERAPLPPEDWLPPDLRALVLHQKHDIGHERFGRDVEELIQAIKTARKLRGNPSSSRRWGKIAGGVLAAAALATAVLFSSQYIADLSQRAAEATAAAEDARRVQAEIAAKAEEERGRAEAAAKEQEEQQRLAKLAEEEANHEAEATRLQQAAMLKADEAKKRIEAARKAEPARQPGETFSDCPECPQMTVVPAGTFMMGPNDMWGSDDQKSHQVTIARPFAVGKYSVTFEEWDACAAAGGCNGFYPTDGRDPAGYIGTSPGWGRGRMPVINVTWAQAKTYTAWLSQRTGRSYRLLTEAEWEYAARAGTTTNYWWGDDVGQNRANCNGCGSQWDNAQTAPVGSFPPNAFGLYDMISNVMELVEDCIQPDGRAAPSDGSALTKSCSVRGRIVRGGSWGYQLMPVNHRMSTGSDTRIGSIGFRVARTLD